MVRKYQNGWNSTGASGTGDFTVENACDDYSCVTQAQWQYANQSQIGFGPVDYGGGSKGVPRHC